METLQKIEECMDSVVEDAAMMALIDSYAPTQPLETVQCDVDPQRIQAWGCGMLSLSRAETEILLPLMRQPNQTL